ncbi:hypothetical protein [Nonomuraea salmonea]|uniref:hypothetical protein n=1 Tax=Nonomuraea salmonea TaxID=46181 RepID=UPI0031EABA37
MAAPAQAAENYGQYSRFGERSAGQHWADGQVAGQWAWKPLSSTTSEISWGDPKKWPPAYGEKFVHSGDWLMLDGWRDNGTYYTVRVTKEQIGDAKCGNLRALATSGRQHYVKWGISSQGYCLKAWGGDDHREIVREGGRLRAHPDLVAARALLEPLPG